MKRISAIYIAEVSPTPLGPIWVAVNEGGLVAVHTHADEAAFRAELEGRYRAAIVYDEVRTREAREQIHAYLVGERQQFELPINWSVMTPFQKKALQATYAIPRGETRTYGQIAAATGNPRAARAVGRAEATNPMPIVIPCHRVIGSDGRLHGYGGRGGLDTKAWLLRLEGALAP